MFGESAAVSSKVWTEGDLPLLPIRETVLFPGNPTPLRIARGTSLALIEALDQEPEPTIVVGIQRVAAVEDPELADLSSVGIVARLSSRTRLDSGEYAVIVVGLQRVLLQTLTQRTPFLRAHVAAFAEVPGDAVRVQYAASVRDLSVKLFDSRPDTADQSRYVRDAQDDATLANLVSAAIRPTFTDSLALFEAIDLTDHLRLLVSILSKQLAFATIAQHIQTTVQGNVSAAQREYFLREQLKAIQNELGLDEGTGSELDALKEKLGGLPLPDAVRVIVSRTLARMKNQPDSTGEYAVALKFLQHVQSLPWSNDSPVVPDLPLVRAELGRLHFGADDVIDWVAEELAVRSRADHASQVLCLVGPPGVGKTSIARAIAGTIKRPLHTISLAGMYDSATIRGHRRTYIGAEPGAFAVALQETGTTAPVIVLDEIDKAGRDSGRGDLRAALLQAVDPILNQQFFDDYLGVPLDLSRVLFIATANQADDIYPPLRSRMRVLTFWGYSPDDKLVIARDYILPSLVVNHGLTGMLEIEDEALRQIIGRYTQEAGVRELARLTEGICRRCAAMLPLGGPAHSVKVTAGNLDSFLGAPTIAPHARVRRARIGRVNSVIVDETGGTVVSVDSIQVRGKGRVTVTGSVNDAVKERVELALSVARRRADRLRLDADVWNLLNLHVHVDANVSQTEIHEVDLALYLSIVSTLIEKPAPERAAGIGTIDLHGDVGGCRYFAARMAAAQRHGLDLVIVPIDHESDVAKLPRRISNDLNFRFVASVDDAVAALFGTI